MKKPHISYTSISKTLDALAEGKGTHKAAKDGGIAPSTAWKVLNEFPLWKYTYEKNKKKCCQK